MPSLPSNFVVAFPTRAEWRTHCKVVVHFFSPVVCGVGARIFGDTHDVAESHDSIEFASVCQANALKACRWVGLDTRPKRNIGIQIVNQANIKGFYSVAT